MDWNHLILRHLLVFVFWSYEVNRPPVYIVTDVVTDIKGTCSDHMLQIRTTSYKPRYGCIEGVTNRGQSVVNTDERIVCDSYYRYCVVLQKDNYRHRESCNNNVQRLHQGAFQSQCHTSRKATTAVQPHQWLEHYLPYDWEVQDNQFSNSGTQEGMTGINSWECFF